MFTKSVPLEGVKAGPDDGLKEGEFLVYPATFTREPDSYGDVIAKGAFADTIKAWKDSGDSMPGMFLHDPNQINSYATDMGEDDKGWWVKGQFDDDPAAQRIYRMVKGRRLTALSFGYMTEDEAKVKLDDGRSVNELRKVNALEFSFLPKGFAANSDTEVVGVKAFTEFARATVKAGRTLSQKNETALRDARDAIDSVLAALGGDEAPTGDEDQDAKASVPAETKPNASGEEPSGVKPPAPGEESKAGPSVDTLAAQLKLYTFS